MKAHRQSLVFIILLVTAMPLHIQGQPYSPEGLTHGEVDTWSCDAEEREGVPLYFDICLGNRKIGEYRTIKFDEGSITRYCAKSVVNLWFFGPVEVKYAMECAFEAGELLYSTCIGHKNGRERLRSEVIRNGDEWLIIDNGEIRKECEPITSSIVALYYREPDIGVLSLVESRLIYKEIIGKEGIMYLLKEPGKRGISEMFYHEGELMRVNVHFPILNFNVVRQTPGLPDCTCTIDVVQ